MIFDLISDLHIDFNAAWSDCPTYDGVSAIYPWHEVKESDILVIPGDIANDPYTALGLIEEAKGFYSHVIFTDGNHDHHGYDGHSEFTPSGVSELYQRYADDNPGVSYLNGSEVLIGNTLFIGANGWYDWRANQMMSYQQQKDTWAIGNRDSIINFDQDRMPDVVAQEQAEALRVLVEQATENPEVHEIVILTHTIPHRGGLVPDTHPWGPLNGSFMTTLMEQVWLAPGAEKIKVWCFGHTHFNYDFEAEGIRFINNSRGYPRERQMMFQYPPMAVIDTTQTGERSGTDGVEV